MFEPGESKSLVQLFIFALNCATNKTMLRTTIVTPNIWTMLPKNVHVCHSTLTFVPPITQRQINHVMQQAIEHTFRPRFKEPQAWEMISMQLFNDNCFLSIAVSKFLIDFHIHMKLTTFSKCDYERTHACKRHISLTEPTTVIDYLKKYVILHSFKNHRHGIHSVQMRNHNFIFMK